MTSEKTMKHRSMMEAYLDKIKQIYAEEYEDCIQQGMTEDEARKWAQSWVDNVYDRD